MKRLFSLSLLLLTVMASFALEITPGKVYKINNYNDGNAFLQDNGVDIICVGGLNANSYWTFEATSNDGCFYVKNVTTGKYMQEVSTTSEVEVALGETKVEYHIVNDGAKGADIFGLTSTNQSNSDFAAGCLGLNWKNNGRAQSFAAVLGANPRSFWRFTEVSASPYTGNAVTAGDEWYLYNVETGYWLGNNNHKWGDWTTRAQANEVGLDFKLEAINGGWRIDPKYGRNNSMNSSNFYLDTNDAVTAWTFDEVACNGATKAYKIHAGDKYLGVVLNTNDKQHLGYQLDFDGKTQGTWVLVTREQRLAIADEEHPVDASFLIPCYDMGDNNPRYAWTLTSNGSKDGPKVMWEHNRVWETWGVTEMDAYTTCTNIPNGKYRVYSIGAYVPTGGSGMNGNDYDNYKANGSAAVHALAYANGKTAKMASVYSVENATQENEHYTKEVKSGVWVPSGWGAIANHCGHYNRYWSEPVEVVVTDGNLRLGVKMEDGAPKNSWVIFSGMRMKYLGEVSDLLTPALESLNTAITAAQAIDQDKLTDAAKTALADALAAAQALTESTDVDAIIAATTALNNVVNDVKDMNATALKAAIDYVEGRGYSDAHAADVYANATKAADVNNEVNGLKVRFKQHVAEKSVQPTQFTKVTEAILGEQDNVRTFVETDLANGLYIYNVGTGRWFCGGDDWGAHAAVGFPGIKVTLPADNYGTGQYNSIITHLYNGNWGNGGKLNHDGYCDTGGNGWKFYNVDASKGIVTIARNGSNTGDQSGNGFGTKNLVGFSNNTFMRVDTNKEGAENPNNQWIFVTEAQRDAMAEAAFASATAENPVDLTYKIGMPGFNQRERVQGSNQDGETLAWTCNHANYRYDAENNGSRHAICERGGNHADFCIDIYGGQWNDAFSWTQTITNLAPGKYRVKVQGYNNRGAEENQAKLVANDKSVTLRQASTETTIPWVGRLADNTWEAVEYFENGLYWNEVECFVTDGTLTIGVTSPSISGDHVVLFDNFRLEYVGEVPAQPESMAIRSHGKWDGVAMTEADDSTPYYRHFTATDFFVNDVQQEGIFINFKNGDDWYCPASGENTVVNAGEEVTEIAKLDHEARGWVVQNQTGYMTADVYCTPDGMKVVFNDNTLEAMQDVDALYVVGEQTTGWSRESSQCPKLEKKSDGVYEGTVEIKRDNTVIDAIRLITRPDNGDNDNHIGSLNVPTRYISGEQRLGTGSTGRMYLRKGEQKITVNFNEGTFTVDPVGVAPSYVYAVGTLVDHSWQNGDTSYKLDEIEPNVFKGIVKVAEVGDSRFSLFFERTAGDWNTGRVGPADQSIHPEEDVVATNRIEIGEDRAWRVPNGEWMVTLDIANQTFLYSQVHTQNVVVGAAGIATFVAEYPYNVIPAGAKVKAAQVKETYVHLEDMTEVPAGEAVVIEAPAGTYTFTEANTAKNTIKNDLLPSDGTVEGGDNIFVLANKTLGIGFYPVEEGTYVAAGKGYLDVATSGAKFLGFDPEGETTAIEGAIVDKFDGTRQIYNISGQKINTPVKGINIINGKKVVF